MCREGGKDDFNRNGLGKTSENINHKPENDNNNSNKVARKYSLNIYYMLTILSFSCVILCINLSVLQTVL